MNNITGFTEDTPKNLLLGAGKLYKNLKFSADGTIDEKNSKCFGATSGGNVFTVTPEFFTPEIDGVYVKMKGNNHKVGETATLEVNMTEFKRDILMSAAVGELSDEENAAYDVITSKAEISDEDYYDNIAFVGEKTDSTLIIIVMENALCTGGLGIDAKHKDTAKPKLTFECNQHAGGDPRKLPWTIYCPKEHSSDVQPTGGEV